MLFLLALLAFVVFEVAAVRYGADSRVDLRATPTPTGAPPARWL